MKRERVRVIYRIDRRGTHDVTAIFPEMSEGAGRFTCYAHVGQHSIASREWIRTTQPATPLEYASLHHELVQIYHDCELIISARMTRARG